MAQARGGGRSVEGNRSRTGKNKPASLIAGAAGKKAARAKSSKAKAASAKASGMSKPKAKTKSKPKSKSAKRK